jgi:serine/threonine-protein kinase
MGFVFAARHLNLNELVAVKVLHPRVAVDDESVERFLREARACVKIKNDHVVKVLDVFTGDHGTPPYILMEFLSGAELGKVLAEHGPMPIPMAVDYVLQASEAIAEAHAYGIVHRDIKPANLLLTQTSDGTPFVKVLDFGISKALVPDDDARNQNLTETTAVFGSPTYMSPEQVRSSKHVDARADVWSLGVVLFELLTGRVPFNGESMSGLLASIVADAPIPLSRLRPDAPPGLERAIAGCLEKNRDMRVPSVAALAQLLAPFASANGQTSVEVIQRLASSVSTGSSLRPSLRPPPSGMPGSSSSPVAYGATEPSIVTVLPIPRRSSGLPLFIAFGVLLGLVVAGAGLAFKLRSDRIARAADLPESPSASALGVSSGVVAPSTSAVPTTPAAVQSSPSTAVSHGSAVPTQRHRPGAPPVIASTTPLSSSPPISAPIVAPPVTSAKPTDPLDGRY